MTATAPDVYSKLAETVGRSFADFSAAAATAAEATGDAIATLVQTKGLPAIRETTELKIDGSPVSEADRLAHQVLTKALRELSSFPIVSEEDPSGPLPPNEAIRSEFFWLADPLDGTRDFLAGETSYAVALALMHSGDDGVKPILGCINEPLKRTTWWGGNRQLYKRSSGVTESVATAASAPHAPLRILGSRSSPNARMQALYDLWGISNITRLGSALKFAMIAEGSYDVYPRLGPTSEWDTAAGQAMLEACGGGVYALATAGPLTYGKTGWRNSGFVAGRSSDLLTQWLPAIKTRLQQV